MAPQEYPRRVLLAATGISLQIVTETLYRLIHQEPPFIPTEIALVATGDAAERVRLELLSADPGWFHRLCRDCGIDRIRFEESDIRVLAAADGQPLADIRDLHHNERAADLITDVVRELSADPNCAITPPSPAVERPWVSSWGFFLGYAMSLFGRRQDRLSQVLIPEGYEGHPLFFYPTRERRVIYDRTNRPMDTRDATVTLADIPFVRLGDALAEDLRTGQAGYTETVERAQRDLGLPEVILDVLTRRVRCGIVVFQLSPANFACYALPAATGLRSGAFQVDARQYPRPFGRGDVTRRRGHLHVIGQEPHHGDTA